EQATELLNATNKDSVVFTPKANGEYTWIVKVVNGDMVAAARATVTVKDADAPLLTLQGRWDCVNDTLVLENSGEAAEKYVWTVDGIETAETGERFVLTDADVKEVRVYAQAANGCLSDTVTIATQLGIIPDVQMSEVAFVNYPDSTHIIRIKQSDGLTEDHYDFTWTSLPDDKINGSRSGLSVLTTPMEEDVKYTFVATSKNNPVCQATDTVWGYMIPKVAAVGIDKDENTGDLYLSWNKEELGLADSVRIMNVKWDGYAVESTYEPLTMVAGEEEQYVINTAKDTLEFFYINASRYIPELGRSYYSQSSDTLGYFKQWLYADAENEEGLSTNYITYPFDMSEKGLQTSHDLGEYIGTYSSGQNQGKYMVNSVASHLVMQQNWTTLRDYYSLSLGMWSGDASFNLQPGLIYAINLQEDADDVVLHFYGKLPKKFTYSFVSTDNTDEGESGENFMAFPLTLTGKRKLTDLGDCISERNSLSTFTFKNLQVWSSERVYWSPSLNLWTGKTEIMAYPWMPINVIVYTNSIFSK
ncbi:MAG: hypothetical protein K2I90_11165, partial [Odoribacter sp.]|nr:hypothetical protein [Odoribacter sp.]